MFQIHSIQSVYSKHHHVPISQHSERLFKTPPCSNFTAFRAFRVSIHSTTMFQIHNIQSIQSVHSQRPHHYVPKFRGCIHSIPTTLYHIHSIRSQCPSPPCTNLHTMWVDDLFALSNLPSPPCTNIPSIHSQHSQHPQHPVPKFTASIHSIPNTFYQHSQHPHHPVPKLTVFLPFTTPIHSVPTTLYQH